MEKILRNSNDMEVKISTYGIICVLPSRNSEIKYMTHILSIKNIRILLKWRLLLNLLTDRDKDFSLDRGSGTGMVILAGTGINIK